MHQVTVIEPKWLSEVAPTFFRVADHNKISKRKQAEKIEPLFDRFATDKDDWVSPHISMTDVSVCRNSVNRFGLRKPLVAVTSSTREVDCVHASRCKRFHARSCSCMGASRVCDIQSRLSWSDAKITRKDL